jgi:serine/threonine protein kinase
MTPQQHPAAETLELYVIGAHDEIPVVEIEAHLGTCSSCTEELRRQAQVDLALTELATEVSFCPGCSAILAAARCPACGAVAEAGGFRVDRLITQNARGRIYLARGRDNDQAGQAVALKELAFVQPPHPDALAAFERESRLLRQITHPQIPRFVAAFSEGEGVATRLYLAQEYVEGESLLARLARHQFSEAEAVEVAEQVLQILAHLQSLSPMVFHRDIKPSNLIRRPDGRIALVDFGAARDLGPTAGATLVGTFGYMPIEQMGGIVDATTDPYALGTTLAHLLSRREPWSFLEDPTALARLNVSPGFRDFLTRLMARRPADRFPSATAALAALRTRVRRNRRLINWPYLREHRTAVMLVGMAIPLVLGGVLAMLVPRPTPSRPEGITYNQELNYRRPAESQPGEAVEPVEPVEPVVPVRRPRPPRHTRNPDQPLSREEIVKGMTAIMPTARACYTQYKVPGVATVNVTVGRDGRVDEAFVTGKFADTPSGTCVESAVKAALFPPSLGRKFGYVVPLR